MKPHELVTSDLSMVEIRTEDYQNYLTHLLPQATSYERRFALLRVVARKRGSFPAKLYGYLRRLSRRRPRKPFFVGTAADGIKFLGDFRDSYSVAYAVVPDYNGGIIRFLEKEAAKAPGVIVDVGANLGITAAAMAIGIGDGGIVVAVEAVAETARRAAATFALNRLRNVRLLCMAATSSNGRMTMLNVAGQSAISSIHRTDHLRHHSDVREIRVPSLSLDQVLGEVKELPVAFIKIDVEGHERNVLEGARILIQRDKPRILLEYNPNTFRSADWNAEVIKKFFCDVSPYDVRVLQEDGELESYAPSRGYKGRVELYCTPVG